MENLEKVSITVLLPAGRLPLDMMATAHQLASEYSFEIYLSNAQNLRLIGVPASAADVVKTRLAALGADFKGPGKFPIPKVCIGKDHCNLGIIDTEELSRKILNAFSGREKTKAKFKINVAACTMCCSGVKTTDIGIMATRDGYDVFAGGKGGPFPKLGRRIEKNCDEERVMDIISELVEFHDKKTEKKQRMFKLLDDPEFPFAEV
jgi:dissimilatory sulfite reductase (desulfoviridin) alpha/beta subunit